MRSVSLAVLAAFGGLTVGALHRPAVSSAPIPLSQHGSVSQSIAGTEITIEYNWLVARGRVLFGGVVPWGKPWCPGADSRRALA